MKAVNFRIDPQLIALLNTLKKRGYGTSSTDVLRKSITWAAVSSPGDLANAYAQWLAGEKAAAPKEAPRVDLCPILGCDQPIDPGTPLCKRHNETGGV